MMTIQSIHLNFVPRRMKMHYNSTFVKKIEIFHRGGHPIPRSTHFDVLSLRSPWIHSRHVYKFIMTIYAA